MWQQEQEGGGFHWRAGYNQEAVEDQARKLNGGHTLKDFNGKVRSFGEPLKSLTRRVA